MSNPKPAESAEGAPKSGAEICLESIEDKLSMLSSDKLSYGRVCIYKVPEKHRNKNPEAYTPRLVSIGLIHYGENQVQNMEENKLKYLSNFLRSFHVDLKELVEYVDKEEKVVCCCYEDVYVRYVSENKSKVVDEDTNYVRYVSRNKPKVPSEVILLDGVFVLQLFLKNHFVELRESVDMLFDNPWISNEILHDLLLFENQLPFGFLYNLYENFVFKGVGKWLGDESIYPPSFDELTHKYFKDVGNTGKLLLRDDARKARHFVEFLSILHRPYENESDDKESTRVEIKENGEMKSDFAKCAILKRPYQRLFTKSPILPKPYDEMQSIKVRIKGKAESKSDYTKCPTTTELQAAGVKFRTGTTNCLLGVRFDIKAGVLQIPPLTVNDSTETFLRNVIAFEQSGCYTKYATSLVILLDNLIDTPKDVDILDNHGIIENQLGSSKEVADLFNSIYKEFLPDPKEFYFEEVCRQLNAYSRDWWHKIIAAVTGWFVMLKRDYFNSPWSIISVIAAIIVLGLTVIQTAYSIKG